MKITAHQINDMAQDLESGMKIFINRKTLEYSSILDWDEMIETEIWEEEMKKIEREWPDNIVIEKMESREVFEIMSAFVDEVVDKRFSDDLIRILDYKNPFANYKRRIESSHYREQWFAFRTRKYEDYVRKRLDHYKIKYE